MTFKAPPLETPSTPTVRFLAAYGSTRSWEAWIGSPAVPIFIGRVRKLQPQEWRNDKFPQRRFRTRQMAGEDLL